MDQINEAAAPLSLDLRVGPLYDTRVGVEYTGNDSGKDLTDEGLALNLSASWQKPVTENFGFRLGYDADAVIYKDLYEYNVIDQAATLEFQWVKGRFMFSLPAGYDYALEDGHSDYYRITLNPTCTLLFAQGRQAVSLFGLYAGIKDKDSAVQDEDSTSTGGGCAYILQREDQTRLHLSLAYQSTDYDAVAADYDSSASRDNRLDKAAIANADFYFPLSARLGFYTDYIFIHNNSNVPMYDYDRHTIEGGVAIKIF